jgi:hypothetical protein
VSDSLAAAVIEPMQFAVDMGLLHGLRVRAERHDAERRLESLVHTADILVEP